MIWPEVTRKVVKGSAVHFRRLWLCNTCKTRKTIPNCGEVHELHKGGGAFSLLCPRKNPRDVPASFGPFIASGPMMSVYFRDPDSNLVEVPEYERNT